MDFTRSQKVAIYFFGGFGRKEAIKNLMELSCLTIIFDERRGNDAGGITAVIGTVWLEQEYIQSVGQASAGNLAL